MGVAVKTGSLVRYEVKINGTVRGRGFRPYVFNLARQHGLKGRVSDSEGGLELDVEGGEKAIRDFLTKLKYRSPQLASITSISWTACEPHGYEELTVTGQSEAEKASWFTAFSGVNLYDREGRRVPGRWKKELGRVLADGRIVAVRSIGICDIVCDARNETAVKRLRAQLNWERKPFLLVCRDLEVLKSYFLVDDEQLSILTSPGGGKLLAEPKKAGIVSQVVAPGEKRLQVVLPYTPLHAMMFDDRLELIATAHFGPREIVHYRDDNEALVTLADFVDYLLVHHW